MNPKCSYHPEKISVTTCERCNRPICESDKRIYRQIHYENDDSSYYTYHTYCIICKAAQLKENNLRSLIILGIIGLILSFIALRTEFYVSLLILGFIGVGAIAFYFYRIKPAVQLEKDAIQFKHSLGIKSHDLIQPNTNNLGIQNYFSNKDYYTINCFQCGTIIRPTDQFCPQCGDNTKEEFSN